MKGSESQPFFVFLIILDSYFEGKALSVIVVLKLGDFSKLWITHKKDEFAMKDDVGDEEI